MRRNDIFLFIFLVIGSSIHTIAQIAPGQWREMLPYYEFRKIIPVGTKLYCPTDYSMMIYDNSDQSVTKISKITGLSEIGISATAYSSTNNCFIIGYLSSNVDIVKGKEIINFPDIKNKLGISNKTILGISVIENYAYICCSFGIVVMDLERLEIKETYYIGDGIQNYKVYDICLYGTDLYAATELGVYRASYNDPNLVNFANWTKINSIPDSTFTSVKSFGTNLFALQSGASKTLYQYNGSSWILPSFADFTGITSFDVQKDLLIISKYSYGVFLYNTSLSLQKYYDDYGILAAAVDEAGTFWVTKSGVIRSIVNGTIEKKIVSDGPNTVQTYGITAHDGTTWISHGGPEDRFTFLPSYSSGGISVNSKDGWNLVNRKIFPDLNETYDFLLIAVNPLNSADAFAASLWGKGLIELSDYGKSITIFNSTNTEHALQSNLGEDDYRIAGLSYDSNNNLWISCQYSSHPIVVKKADGNFKSFSFQGALNNYNIRGAIVAASNGQKWVILGKGGGLFVFDDNNTIDDESDDEYRVVSVKVSEVDNSGPYNDIRSIAEDKDGYIWLGTSDGPIVYFNPGDIIKSNIEASRIKVPKYDGKNGASILLENETINGIAVDGGNRKWLATDHSGAFLISSDGKKQIYNFREETSPIFSNTILNVAVDNKSGEVFFASNNGVSVYRGDAAEGGSVFGKIYAYPNPVKEDYEGEIIVTGLIANTNIKITDITGNLVYETTSNGSQANWNGKNFSGQRVHTGVYLIFCATPDGSQTHIAKLLFIH